VAGAENIVYSARIIMFFKGSMGGSPTGLPAILKTVLLKTGFFY